jgi:hypothetical protein
VFSIGDVLIVVGSTYLAHRWCSRPRGRELAALAVDASDDVTIDAPIATTVDSVSAGAHELV